MNKPSYVVNLKNPEDSPEKIAQKLNSLSYAIDSSVIRNVATRDELEKLEKKTKQFIEATPEMLKINMNDQRWHGGGLSKVIHDVTLTGDGTASSPLSSVSSSTGTVTSVSTTTASGITATVASATTTPLITIAVDGTHYVPTTTDQTNWNNKGNGTVTSLSVVTANGISGTVASATTTPAVTLALDSTYPTTSSTSTLTNKRITKRVLAIASGGAVPSYNTDNYDVIHIYGQPVAITSFTTGASGTPIDGDTLRMSILATGSAALAFGTNFEASTIALPTTTASTARLDIGFIYNTETGKWRCTAVA